jgi:hypothetical protein
MATTLGLVNTYGNVGNDDIDNMQVCLDDQRIGYHQLTLTEMYSTTIPQIAAGGRVEVGGALYKATADVDISGSVSSGTNYIYLVPGTGVVTPTWTTTAPTWSDVKQGWYGTGASASYRYLKFTIEYDNPDYYKYRDFFTEYKNTYVEAFKSSSTSSTSGVTLNPIIYDTEVADVKSEYDNSSGIFEAKESGIYLVSANMGYYWYTGTINNFTATMNVYKNLTTTIWAASHKPDEKDQNGCIPCSIPIKLNTGDQITVGGVVSADAGTGVGINGNYLYYTSLRIARLF